MRLMHTDPSPHVIGAVSASEHDDGNDASKSRAGRPSYVHPTAIVGAGVKLGEGVWIGPRVTIDRDASIGAGTRIEAGAHIGNSCRIGADCKIGPNVTVREKTILGARVVLESGVALGSDGFGFADCADRNKIKMPQVGTVIIGDDVFIGANTTVDRATMGETQIGNRVRIGTLSQIAHNVVIGDDTTIGSRVGICGSVIIGKGAWIGSGVGVVGHLTVADGAVIMDGAGVTTHVAAGETMAGFPAVSKTKYEAVERCLENIPELFHRLQVLEEGCNGHLKATQNLSPS